MVLLFVLAGSLKLQAGRLITHDEPLQVTIYNPDFYPCPGQAVNFTAIVTNGSADIFYQWQVNGINAGANSASFSYENSLTNPAKQSDVIQCLVTDNSNGTSAASNKLTNIKVTGVPVLFLKIIPQTIFPVCKGTTALFGTEYSNFQDNGITNLNYLWYINGKFVHSGPTFISNTLADGDIISLTGTYTGKCFPNTDVKAADFKAGIMNTAIPTLKVTPVDAAICADEQAMFKAVLTNGGSLNKYQWTVNGTNAGENDSTFSSSGLKTGDSVTCRLVTANICGIDTLVSGATVTVIPETRNKVTITSDAVNNFITANQLVTFKATATYTGAITYQWQVNGKNTGTNSKTFATDDLTIGDIVTCSVTAAAACVVPEVAVSNAITILMHIPLKIPNTFTPNGDGINDNWDIKALLIYPACRVQVYDRYGAQVYQSTGYPKSWDGTRNGSRLPVGVYYYIINLADGTSPYAGYVTILR